MYIAQVAKAEQGRVTDGFMTLENGVESGFDPSLIGPKQLAWLVNGTVRGGYVTCRPGWRYQNTTGISGYFQGFGGYVANDGTAYLCMSVAGRIYTINASSGFTTTDITGTAGPSNVDAKKVWFLQANKYLITQNLIDLPFIWDGGSSRRADPTTEVPIGGPMAYYMGRIVVGLSADRTAYRLGDLIYGDNAFGVANILRFTETTFLSEGGDFITQDSNAIVGIKAAAQLDTTLGQGDLCIFTNENVFAFNAPVDRTQWKSLTYPIQRQILPSGAVSDTGITGINTDLVFRSLSGVRSLKYARQDNDSWGNTPISRQDQRAFQYDTQNWLYAASDVNFDNRYLCTAQPHQDNAYGIWHSGIAPLDYFLTTGMGEKLPPVWEGIWTGLKILAIQTLNVNGVVRCFLFVLSPTNTIDIWEITKDGIFDYDGTNDVPIKWIYETRSFTCDIPEIQKDLIGADQWYDQVAGNVTVAIKYKSNQSNFWTDWWNWTQCVNYRQCDTIGYCPTYPTTPMLPILYFQPGSFPRKSAPRPQPKADPQTNGFVNQGYNFQVRYEITGKIRMKDFKLVCLNKAENVYGDIDGTCPELDPGSCSTGCLTIMGCDPNDYNYSIYG
jgi:hypothetical protein